jgi:hypothetical protein
VKLPGASFTQRAVRAAIAHAPLTLLCLAACGSSAEGDGQGRAPRERTSLIEHERFQLMDDAGDPFADRPAEPVTCQEWAYLAEYSAGERVFALDTDGCAYATFMQPALVDVREGDFLHTRVWHFKLVAFDPAEAHVSVTLGTPDFGLDERIAIPSVEGALLAKTWQAPRDYPAGTPVYFHVHNHGNNEYQIIELSTGTDDPSPKRD